MNYIVLNDLEMGIFSCLDTAILSVERKKIRSKGKFTIHIEEYESEREAKERIMSRYSVQQLLSVGVLSDGQINKNHLYCFECKK